MTNNDWIVFFSLHLTRGWHWHHLINYTQAQQLESIPKRAIHIIFNVTNGMPYPNFLFVAELESLGIRWSKFSRSFFRTFANEPPINITLFYLREIPRLSLRWDLPLFFTHSLLQVNLPFPFQNPIYVPKSTVHLYTWSSVNKVTPNHSTLHIPPTASMTYVSLF